MLQGIIKKLSSSNLGGSFGKIKITSIALNESLVQFFALIK